MSQNPLERIQPGMPFAPNAKHHNLTCEMLADWSGRRITAGVGEIDFGALSQTIVSVQNTTGEDLDRYAIVKLDAPVFGPDDNLAEFLNNPTFQTVAPTAATERYAVLQTPLRKNAIGPAAVAGWTIAKVNFASATPEDGETASVGASSDAFDGDTPGTVAVVWREGITGEQWALVLLHTGSAGGCEPTNAIWGIVLIGTPAAGSFKIIYGAGPGLPPAAETTAPIAYNASPAAVQSALEALPSLNSGDVIVTGASSGFSYHVEFAGTLAHRAITGFVIDASLLLGHGVGAATMLVQQGRT